MYDHGFDSYVFIAVVDIEEHYSQISRWNKRDKRLVYYLYIVIFLRWKKRRFWLSVSVVVSTQGSDSCIMSSNLIRRNGFFFYIFWIWSFENSTIHWQLGEIVHRVKSMAMSKTWKWFLLHELESRTDNGAILFCAHVKQGLSLKDSKIHLNIGVQYSG